MYILNYYTVCDKEFNSHMSFFVRFFIYTIVSVADIYEDFHLCIHLTHLYLASVKCTSVFLVLAHPGSPGQRAIKWVT